jgi:P27 family predicted phage terminase small subunit
MVETLFSCGIMTRVDGGSLTRYITSFGRWVEAERALAEGEPTFHEILDEQEKVKAVVMSKAYATVCKEHERLLKLEQEFGLTPASRPRLQAVKPTKDAIEEIFGELA